MFLIVVGALIVLGSVAFNFTGKVVWEPSVDVFNCSDLDIWDSEETHIITINQKLLI